MDPTSLIFPKGVTCPFSTGHSYSRSAILASTPAVRPFPSSEPYRRTRFSSHNERSDGLHQLGENLDACYPSSHTVTEEGSMATWFYEARCMQLTFLPYIPRHSNSTVHVRTHNRLRPENLLRRD